MHTMRFLRFAILLLLPAFFLMPGDRLCSQVLPASAGTEFYLGVPFIGIAGNATVHLSVTAVQPATVTVTLNGTTISETQYVEPGTPWEFQIPRFIIGFSGQYEGKDSHSIHIASDQPVTVQATHDALWYCDSWIVPPVSQLGTDYWLMSVGSLETTYGGIAMAVATEDNTTLRITPSVNTEKGPGAGYSYGVTLNEGEVWQVVPSQPMGTDMTGTHFQSDKPIALYGGHAGAKPGGKSAANPLLESFTPIEQWGTQFFGISLPRRVEGHYKIVAHRNSTFVMVNDVVIKELNEGEHLFFNQPGPIDISTNEPVTVAQFVYRQDTNVIDNTPFSSGDPSMTLLQPYSSWSTQYRWMTQNLDPRGVQGIPGISGIPFEHFLIVTARTDFGDSVYIDNVDMASFFRVRSSDPDWKTAIIPIQPGEHKLVSSSPVGAQLLGYSNYDAYFMPAGYRTPPPIRILPITTVSCEETFDTAIALRNFSNSAVKIDSVTFEGVDGEFPIPSLPFTIPPSRTTYAQLRIHLPSSGETRGKVLLHSGGEIIPYTIPVRAERQVMAGNLSTGSIRFANLGPADPLVDSIISVTNTGDLPIHLTNKDITFPFSLVAPSLPLVIPPGESRNVQIRFAPGEDGDYRDTLRFTTEPCDLALQLPLAGSRSQKPIIDIAVGEAPYLVCPEESPGMMRLVLYNRGGEPLEIDSATLGGSAAGDYTLQNDLNGSTILPGDSLELDILFHPDDAGLRQGELTIFHNVDPGLSVIELGGTKDSILLETSLDEIDLGTILLCTDGTDSTLSLSNNGTLPLDLTTLAIQTNTFTLTGNTNKILNPGETLDLTVSFLPEFSGDYTDTLLIACSPCNIERRIPLRISVRRASIQVQRDTIDFGLLTNCDEPESIGLRLFNDGDIPSQLTTLDLAASGFDLAAINDSIILPGTTLDLSVQFSTDSSGIHTGQLIVRSEPCGIERVIVLRGEYRTREVDPLIESIRFSDYLPGDEIREERYLHNDGEVPITVQAITFDDQRGALRLLSPTPGTVIPPGDSIRLFFSYTSENAIPFTTDARVSFTTGCPGEIVFNINGTPGEIPLHLSVKEGSGYVDQKVTLPLLLENRIGFDGGIRLRGELRWDYRNLYMNDLKTLLPSGSMKIETDSIAGTDRIVRFLYEGDLTSPDDPTFGELDLLVLLGTSDSTPIEVTVLELLPLLPETRLAITKEDGSFHTLGICIVDGHRYVAIEDPLQTSKPRPNPAREHVEIGLYSTVEGKGKISIFNSAGNLVQVEEVGISPGEQSIRIRTKDLSSGLYHYLIELGNEVEEGRFLVRQ